MKEDMGQQMGYLGTGWFGTDSQTPAEAEICP